MSISLAKKAIILVAVPLVCEVVFVLVLGGLIFQIQTARASESHARAISTHVNGALVNLLDRFSSCILYHVSDSDAFRQRFNLSRVKLVNELAALRAVVADHPDEKAVIENLNNQFVKCGEDLQRAQGQLELGDKMQAARLWARADKGIEALLKSIDEIIGFQENVIQEKLAQQKERIKAVEIWLSAGIAFNFLLAAILVYYFNRGTTRNLKTLMDNSMRLAMARPLAAPIAGDDEFAHLDRTFREMAQALAESRRKEQAVIDNAADVICTIDREGIFTAVNPAVRKLWGYDEEGLVGESLGKVIFADDYKATIKAIEQIVSSRDKEGSFENRIVCAVEDDVGRVADFAWSAHWSQQDRSLFCVARDITERKEVDRMKADFVAMVSHDLRTPLTSIQMVLSLLAAGAYGQLNDNGHEKLELAEGSIDRLIGLVNGLLDLEKMESGKLELVLAPCTARDIVRASLAAVNGFADQLMVDLETSYQGGATPDTTVLADRDRVVQVVINLLSNAVKFSSRNGTVLLRLEIEKSQRPLLKFWIIDQGRGIPQAMLDTVFDRFKQVEAADATVKGGSGLGLAICKAIVERHEGRIGVSSVEGQGSSFWFTLPLG